MGAASIDVVSLFPEMLTGFLATSILARAQKKGLVHISVHSLRRWARGKHAVTDERPFGGGAGMLLKPEPLFEAVEELRKDAPSAWVIYPSPEGRPFSTSRARELARMERLIFLSGHYEGIDERVREHLVDEEISIGDYVLSNGTLAAAVIIDALVRHIPEVLGDEESLEQDSFAEGLLSFPQYTRPEIFRSWAVPPILLSGHHRAIRDWRQEQRLARTRARRPELWEIWQKRGEKD
ncbi:MAG: tRNA (guanosine(37)-N1)-methyltransferase TrmD [Puniceicoccales bacterium]|jgi:tRNA (guanine37-N1)-methyltransferase|nr:tRNA (guanosine(37)-N1)-methyltransferase TrmD [Puniceicoccales bacterium]